jgi:ABC-type spermidine/putrescine transport system permease subunit I
MSRRLLALPAFFVTGALFIYPVAWIISRSLVGRTGPLDNFRTIFSQPFYLTALLNTLTISVVVTVVTILIGFPLAVTIAKSRGRARSLLLFALTMPFWTSVLVRAFGWTVILQRNGLINKLLLSLGIVDHPLPLIYNLFGTLVGITQVCLPFMVLPIYSVLVRLNPAHMMAARTLVD